MNTKEQVVKALKLIAVLTVLLIMFYEAGIVTVIFAVCVFKRLNHLITAINYNSTDVRELKKAYKQKLNKN